MCRRSNGGDNTERRVFLESNSMIPAAPVRAEPINARNEFNDLQLLDLVVKAADFRFVEFETPPAFGILVGHRLDDLFDFATSGNTFLAEQLKRLLRGSARFVGILKDAKFSPKPGR